MIYTSAKEKFPYRDCPRCKELRAESDIIYMWDYPVREANEHAIETTIKTHVVCSICDEQLTKWINL